MHKCTEEQIAELEKDRGNSACHHCGKQICAECAYEVQDDNLDDLLVCGTCAMKEVRKKINFYQQEVKNCRKYIILFIIGILAIALPVIDYLIGELNVLDLVKILFFSLAYSAIVIVLKAKKYNPDVDDGWLTTLIAAVLSPIYLIIGLVNLFRDRSYFKRMSKVAYRFYFEVKTRLEKEEVS